MNANPTGRVEQMAQAIAARVVNTLVEAVDINALVSKVDIDAVVRQVNVEAIIDRVDIERIIERVDIEEIVERVDIDKIVERVDIDKIVGRLDINAIVQRVDVNAIVQNMDVEALVEKTELGAIIAKSTTGIFTEVLDVIRAQGVGLDDFCARWTNRLLRRDPATLRPGPGMPPPAAGAGDRRAEAGAVPARLGSQSASMPPSQLTVERQGQYAGAVSRIAAFALDAAALWGIYVGAAALLSFAVQLVSGHKFDVAKEFVAADVTIVVWAFAYFAYQWAVAGRTLGMAVLGIRVVAADGSPATTRSGVLRTCVLPVSIAVFFLGCVGILTNRERRAWHDRLAGTAVVYAWDARAARLRWLADRDKPVALPPPIPTPPARALHDGRHGHDASNTKSVISRRPSVFG